MQYSLLRVQDESNITVFVPGLPKPLVAHESHPNFKRIVDAAIEDDPSIAELFDVQETINKRFEKVSERVSLRNGKVFFDGNEQSGTLVDHILRCLDQPEESDFKTLINFYEKIQTNPESHSREQLYDWLEAHDFTIDEDGDIIGYKGVRRDGDDGFLSLNSGSAIVDGEPVDGRVPNKPGSVVEMARDQVAHNPLAACSTGLHVGTFGYAQSFGDVVLEIRVNPRDVVSVPNDANGEKVRVCRYRVVNVISQGYDQPVLRDEFNHDLADEYDKDEDRRCEDCGEYLDDCNCEEVCDNPDCITCYPDG